MDNHAATEVAFKNGYKEGYEAGYKDAWEHPTMKIYKLTLNSEIMVADLKFALNDNEPQTVPIGWCYKDIIKQE